MKRTILCIVFAFSVISCHMFAPTGLPEVTYKIIPGECLLSSDLKYVPKDNPIEDDFCIFSFSMILEDGIYEKVSSRLYPQKYRLMPADGQFSRLKNENAVRKQFKKIYESFTDSYADVFSISRGYEIMTLLYDGGISLIADKDFAGYPAGENLASLITGSYYYNDGTDPVISDNNNTFDGAGQFLDIPLDFISMTQSFISFKIPLNGTKLTDGAIVFTLDIPVKKVHYLTWLDCRIDDPEAEIQYEDIILHCKFRTDFD